MLVGHRSRARSMDHVAVVAIAVHRMVMVAPLGWCKVC